MSSKVDSSLMLNSFILLDDQSDSILKDDSNLSQAIRSHNVYQQCLRSSEAPKVSLCESCAESMDNKANMETTSCSHMISAYESMIMQQLTENNEKHNTDDQEEENDEVELKISNLRETAANCRYEEDQLKQELFSLKQTQLNCAELEEDVWASLSEFEKIGSERNIKWRECVESCYNIARGVDKYESVDHVFNVELSDSTVSVNGMLLDDIGERLGGWVEAGCLLAYVRSQWNLPPLCLVLSPYSPNLGQLKASDEDISQLAHGLNSTMVSIAERGGPAAMPMPTVTSRFSLMMVVGDALSHILSSIRHHIDTNSRIHI